MCRWRKTPQILCAPARCYNEPRSTRLKSLTLNDQNAGGFEPGEMDALLAVGDADIEHGDVLDGEQALAEKRRRRALHPYGNS